MKYPVPGRILEQIGSREYRADSIGMSNADVVCFSDMVLKMEPAGPESDNELRMMRWLQGRLPVPRLIDAYRENGVNYLLMSRVRGDMACDPRFLEAPEEAVLGLAQGLKLLWNVDPTECPFYNTVDVKLRMAGQRIAQGLCSVDDAEPDTFGEAGYRDPTALWAWLDANRPEEDLVFSHGDYCLPNIFLENGGVSGLIDLGRSGIADRWQDVALCIRSIRHNFGDQDGLVRLLLRELSLEPDRDKIRYYILLDELF